MESDTAEQVTIEQEKSQQKTSTQNTAEQKSAETWAHIVRGLYVLLFWVILRISEFVVAGVALLTFGFKLATGKAQPRVQAFGNSLSTYMYQVVSFMTYKSDSKPFPFQEWPEPDNEPESVVQEERTIEVVEVVVAEEDQGRQNRTDEGLTGTGQPPPGKGADEARPSA